MQCVQGRARARQAGQAHASSQEMCRDGVVDGRWTAQDKKEKRCALAKTFKSKDERRLAHHQGGRSRIPSLSTGQRWMVSEPTGVSNWQK